MSTYSKIRNYAGRRSEKVGQHTLKNSARLSRFLVGVADVSLFWARVFRNTFSRGFEFQEFLKQCFMIGNKSLGLISITGVIIGLVLTIPCAAFLSAIKGNASIPVPLMLVRFSRRMWLATHAAAKRISAAAGVPYQGPRRA